jgi:ABC-2 type transport system ATP-binding protein
LDEPTSGADVATRAKILELVRDMAAQGSAVLYSTHYLHEVEALGATVTILEHGRVIAHGDLADLVARYGGSALEMTFNGPAPVVDLDCPVTREDSRLRISTDNPAATAVTVLAALNADAARLQSIEIVRPSLESVYLTLTGKRYAEGPAVRQDEQARVPSA